MSTFILTKRVDMLLNCDYCGILSEVDIEIESITERFTDRFEGNNIEKVFLVCHNCGSTLTILVNVEKIQDQK